MNNKHSFKIGYIINGGEYIVGNNHKKCFKYVEYDATERKTPGGTVLCSKQWKPFSVESVKSNTNFMNQNNAILIRNPFFTNDETAEKLRNWCAMANEKNWIGYEDVVVDGMNEPVFFFS